MKRAYMPGVNDVETLEDTIINRFFSKYVILCREWFS